MEIYYNDYVEWFAVLLWYQCSFTACSFYYEIHTVFRGSV